MITPNMIGEMTRIQLCLPDGTMKWFDVIWNDDKPLIVTDFYGWELHVNLRRLLDRSETTMLGWEGKTEPE